MGVPLFVSRRPQSRDYKHRFQTWGFRGAVTGRCHLGGFTNLGGFINFLNSATAIVQCNEKLITTNQYRVTLCYVV